MDLFEHGGCASVRPKGKEQAENWHLTNLDACTPHGKVEKNIEPNQPIWGFPAVRWKTGFQPFMSMLGHAPKKGTSSPQAPMFELLALGGNILWLNSALQKELSEFSLKLNHPRLSNQLVNTYHIYSIYIYIIVIFFIYMVKTHYHLTQHWAFLSSFATWQIYSSTVNRCDASELATFASCGILDANDDSGWCSPNKTTCREGRGCWRLMYTDLHSV